MQIEHRREAHQFRAQAPTGTAVLSYAPAGDGVIDIYSTYVPAADRGRGLGGELVQAALVWVRAERLRVIPSCWFAAQWIQDHPEHRDLLAAY